MSHFSSMRRRVAVLLAASTLTLGVAQAADPLAVGVLLPGSTSDKGWMESGYDGLTAVQKEARQQDQGADDREREASPIWSRP